MRMKCGFIALLSLFVMVAVQVLPGAAVAGTLQNWELVYETDGNQDCVTGYCDLTALVNAVKDGCDVKVVAYESSTNTYRSRILTTVVVKDNPADGVWGKHLSILRDTGDDVVHITTGYSTTGDVTLEYVGGGTSRPSDDEVVRAIKWYVSP